jgi:spore coat polysaccharide biosynthesis protein SpsF (cytidylyltransferase family)
VNIPPLCIIQARYNSSRLPAKMLLKLDGETLIARAWRVACEAFGEANVVVALPDTDVGSPLDAELRRIGANALMVPGLAEDDVLGRFYRVVHRHRWHPDSVIVRYTPDDHRKDVASLQRVAAGQRLPVEMGGEAFTLAMLEDANGYQCHREHITYTIYPVDAPAAPDDGKPWSIDTPEDAKAAGLT